MTWHIYLLVQTLLWTVLLLWFYGPEEPEERFSVTRRQWAHGLTFAGANALLAVSLLLKGAA